MSKVLIDNGSAFNVMSSLMLGALGKNTNDLIKFEVYVFAFTREISKNLGILPIDITIGSKTSLFAFIVINFTTNYNALYGSLCCGG